MAPKGWEHVLSYWTGALTSAAWFFWTSGTYLLDAEILLAAIEVLYPNYTTQAWHLVLISWAVTVLSVVWNIPFFKSWPTTLKAMVVVTNAGSLFVAIALLARSHPKQSAHTVFVDIVNESGWSSTSVVFLLGLLPGTTAINGFDSASHMTEEMPDPARQVPQVMVGNALLSGLSGLPMVIIYCFCIVNMDNLVDPVGGMTIIQIFKDSLDSKALFIMSVIIYVVVTTVACVACTTTTSRVWWSFSEHHGLPFSGFFHKIQTTKLYAVPVNAILVVGVLSCIINLLELGPSFVLAALFSAANVSFYLSYFIAIGCHLYTKWSKGLPPHYMNLGGIFGNITGIVSMVWAVFVSACLCIPYYQPILPKEMNYTSAVLGVVGVLFTVDWLVRGKRAYIIPSPLLI